MRVRELRSLIEFRSLIEQGTWLILFVEDRESRKSKYAVSLLNDIAPYMFRLNVATGIVYGNVSPRIVEEESIDYYPYFKLYMNGSAVWEQIGCLMNYENDIKVLKRSIREVVSKL